MCGTHMCAFMGVFVTSLYHTVCAGSFSFTLPSHSLQFFSHYHSFLCLSSPAEKRESFHRVCSYLCLQLSVLPSNWGTRLFYLFCRQAIYTHTEIFWPCTHAVDVSSTSEELFNSVAHGMKELPWWQGMKLHAHLDVDKGYYLWVIISKLYPSFREADATVKYSLWKIIRKNTVNENLKCLYPCVLKSAA